MPPHSQSKIYFFFDGVKTPLANRTLLKRFVESIFRSEGKKLETLVYVFTTDQNLLRMNREYLGHDYYTDIISFDLSENGQATLGEIYISTERVRANARLLKVPDKTELHRVIFHGALHLCGYKDKNQRQLAHMRRKEDEFLMDYFKGVPRAMSGRRIS